VAFLSDWLTYINGYIVLQINGENCETFLNLAIARGVGFWDINRTGSNSKRVKMQLREYRALRSLARESRCRIRIVDKRGLPFLKRRLRGRQMLLIGGLFFLLALYLLSMFVWVVDVTSEYGPLKQVSQEQILEAARTEGLRPGAKKSNLDIRQLEKKLERRFPCIAWVGISLNGTRVEIKVVEKVKPPEEPPFDQPASIVAAKDGVIKEILVISGEGRVKVGDAVRKGEILISGLILPQKTEEKKYKDEINFNPPRLVRARGIVCAMVWYQKEKEVDLLQNRERLTGRKCTTAELITPQKRYILKGPSRSPYRYYREEIKTYSLPSWGNFSLPAEMKITTYYELEVWQEKLDFDEAVEIAARQALKELKEILPEGAVVVKEKIIPLTAPGALNTVKVRTWIETEEDIGKVVPLSTNSSNIQ